MGKPLHFPSKVTSPKQFTKTILMSPMRHEISSLEEIRPPEVTGSVHWILAKVVVEEGVIALHGAMLVSASIRKADCCQIAFRDHYFHTAIVGHG